MQKSGDITGARGTSRGPRPDWRNQAACRQYETTHYDPWEAGPKERKPSHTAATVCSTCPVKHHGVAYHVFGGLAPAQRRALTRARQRMGCPVCKGELIISPMGELWQACASCGVTWKRSNRKPLNEHVDNDDASRTSGANSGRL